MTIKRHTQFLLDKEKDKPDAKIRYRIKWNNNKYIVAFNLGYRADVLKWSVETQRCINNTTHGTKKIPANIINKEIQLFSQTTDDVFGFFELKNIMPSKDEFKSEFNRRLGKSPQNSQQDKTIFDVYDLYILKAGELNSWAETTYMKHKSVRKHLENFDNSITFESITENLFSDFIKYMQSKAARQLWYKSSETGMKNTTTSKNVGYLKCFLRWAKRNGYYSGDAHNTFKPKFKGIDQKNKDIIHLTWDELLHLYNFKFEEEYLSHVRDIFCFCCFTSLRYSDVAKLKRSDVKDDYIKVVTQKTSEGLTIELNKYSKALLDKYRDVAFPDNKVFPIVANPKMNAYIKTMGELAGFNDPTRIVFFIGNNRFEEVHPKYCLLTTHTGRRTFIVNSLYLGIHAEVVMKWTGHSDYDSMKPYIKIVDELKQASMRKFDEK